LAHRAATDPAGSVAGYMDPAPMQPTEWPVAVTQPAGSGRALYVAFGLGRYYANHGLVHARDRMAQYIDRLLPHRQVVVKAPRSLEVTFWQQKTPERTIIHLANRTPLAHDMPRLHEITPLRDIEIAFDAPYPKPRVTCRHSAIVTEIDGGAVRVRLDRLDIYSAIVVEPGGPANS
jgi:hypothetical protein